MKKLTALAASVTMLAGQILNPITTSAMKVNDEGGEYWYIPETIIHDKEVEAEIAEACADSYNYNYCLNVARGRRINSEGNRYQAAYQLRRSRFLITAVNPYRSTVRVYYAGENSVSNTEKANLTELYLYWIDDGKITPELNWELYNIYFNQIRNDEPEDGIHVIYSGARSGEESWIETEEEARLVLSTGSLTNNINGQIFFTIVNDFGDVYSGFYRYQNICLDNEFFGIGQECLGAYYIINDTFTYVLSPYDEIEEDRELELSPLTAEPEVPEDPTEPDEPENPDEPAEPEEPESPEEPGEPTEPEEPVTPDEPENPEDPEDPNEPEDPINSDEPEIPEELDAPEKSEDVEEPIAQAIKQDDQGELATTNSPAESTTSSEVPEEQVQPEEQVEPKEPKWSTKVRISGTDNVGFGGDITIEDIRPKTPDTGETSNDDPGASWCLPVVTTLGLAYIIWWIIPTGKKRRQ